MTLARMRRHGSSVGFWNAMPTRLSGPSTSRPATTTLPSVAGHRPETRRISVLLPQPDGPTTATNSPSRTCIEHSCSASVPSMPP